MKSTTILVAVMLIVATTATPTTTYAAGQAVQITDTTVMFLLDFAVTATDGEYEVPIVASSRVKHNDRVDIMGYNLQSSDAAVPTISTVSGLVLSTSTINENNRYTVIADTIGSFRLAIFATFAEPLTSDVVASITKLPYWVNGNRTTVHQNQINDLPIATLPTQ